MGEAWEQGIARVEHRAFGWKGFPVLTVGPPACSALSWSMAMPLHMVASSKARIAHTSDVVMTQAIAKYYRSTAAIAATIRQPGQKRPPLM